MSKIKDYSLPNRIKSCREDCKLTQPQLAKLIGFNGNKNTISSYERNKRLPSLEASVKLSEALSVSVGYLFYFDKNRNHYEYLEKTLGLKEIIIRSINSIEDSKTMERLNAFIHLNYGSINDET